MVPTAREGAGVGARWSGRPQPCPRSARGGERFKNEAVKKRTRNFEKIQRTEKSDTNIKNKLFCASLKFKNPTLGCTALKSRLRILASHLEPIPHRFGQQTIQGWAAVVDDFAPRLAGGLSNMPPNTRYLHMRAIAARF